MDKVEIAEKDALPLDAIARGVIGLRIVFVNVFAVTHASGRWTLIDAGLPLSAHRIKEWTRRNFDTAPNAIVLTHGHFDHVSEAKELADEWNVPVYAHPAEWPYLTGEKEYPAPNWKAGGGTMSLMSPTLPKGPVDLRGRLQPLPGDGMELDVMPGWTVLHTPGHTPGHCSFYREDDKTLLVGDAFCTTSAESFFEAALAQHAELHGPPAYFTSDWQAAKVSVRKLAGLEPRVVAPGHGKPLTGGDVAKALHKLADDFERVAVPEDEKATV
jgi:glyoxylase-like metal-dependent hydrolase (beta-lactamase superfamily II)